MASKIRQTAFRLEPELLAAMQALKERDGMMLSEQVRRAMRAWLTEKGVMVKADSRRASTRRKS